MAKRAKRRAAWLSHAEVELLESRQLLSATVATATALVTTGNPILVGQTVAFTATVTSASGSPTGIVTIMDGSNVIGTPTIDPTTHQAIDFINVLGAGTHSITAVYTGATGFAGSTSSAINEIVNSTDVATTTSLAASDNPIGIGQTVAFTATVTSNTGTPTGLVTFMDGSNTLGTATINATTHQAIDFVNPLGLGDHTVTAVYSGATGFSASTSSSVDETVTSNTTTTTLTSTASSLQVGQTVAFIATVTSTNGSPAGTVTFMDGSNTLGTANVIAGSQEAVYFTASLDADTHSITAVYNPSTGSTYATSTSSPLSVTVNSAVSTTVSLVASDNPIVFGNTVAFIATVTAASGSPTGLVTFMDGSAVLGTANLNVSTGTAVDYVNPLAIGTHNISAVYAGTMNFAGGTSSTVVETVNDVPATTTTTTIAATSNPTVAGQTIALIATVTSGDGSPGGIVTFMDGSTLLGTPTINTSTNQAIDFVNSLSLGLHPITAVYGGVSGFAGSTSSVLDESITASADATSTTIATTANPTVLSQTIALTATVTAAGGSPTGTVTFMDGSTVIGTPTIDPTTHQAIDFLNSLTVGTHNITAVYAGAGGFTASTSSVLAETVNAVATFATTTTLASSNNPIVVGQTVAFTATVTATSGSPGGNVTFMDGSKVIGTAALNTTTNQAIDFTNALAQGSHNITAVYSATTGFAASSSAVVSEVVNKAGTNLTLSASSVTIGQTVTMTATVATPTGGVPTGTVTFTATSADLGTINLGSAILNSSGVATISEFGLFYDIDTYTIKALYSGDGTHASSSATAPLNVVAPSSPITTADGLQYQIVTPGSGPASVTGQVLAVNYAGYLTDGTEFDSSIFASNDHQFPFEFRVGEGQVIQGWDEGIPGMQAGETRVLQIPAALAYGSSPPQGSVIPANAILVFIVQMVAINQPLLEVTFGPKNEGPPLLNNQAPSTTTGTLFAATTVGSTSGGSSFTLSNADSNVSLESTTNPIVEISGADAGDFILTQPSSISGTFSISFKPTATGTRTATITIATNDPNNPDFIFTVSGAGK